MVAVASIVIVGNRMDHLECNELLVFANAADNDNCDFELNSLLSEPLGGEKDLTTRSQDTLDSFGDFVDDIDIDIDIDLSDDDEDDDIDQSEELIRDQPRSSFSGSSLSPVLLSPSIRKHSIRMPNHSALFMDQPVAGHNLTTSRQIPARAVSYSEGDQQHLLLQIQQQNFLQMQQQQQQQFMLQNSISSIQNTSFDDNNTHHTGQQTVFSQQASQPQMQQVMSSQQPTMQSLPQGMQTIIQPSMQNSANLNDAMEKLCETMKRSAVTRNLVKQLSGRGVTRSNSSAGLVRTHSGKGSNMKDMVRMAPIRRPSNNSKHSVKRGLLRQTSQQSLDAPNHLLQVDGR